MLVHPSACYILQMEDKIIQEGHLVISINNILDINNKHLRLPITMHTIQKLINLLNMSLFKDKGKHQYKEIIKKPIKICQKDMLNKENIIPQQMIKIQDFLDWVVNH